MLSKCKEENFNMIRPEPLYTSSIYGSTKVVINFIIRVFMLSIVTYTQSKDRDKDLI